MQAIQKYELWLQKAKDNNVQKQLQSMTDEQISSAFFKDLEFGTAGMRGIVGAGSNCMNIYTVGKVTEAVARYLDKKPNAKIAVSYDSRNMSKEFSNIIAEICALHNIKVYLADKMMPTPFLSYMVRYYGCDLGVMITASHNPKEYNGYKLYDSNGCQLLDEPSKEIMAIAEQVDMFNIDTMPLDVAVDKGLVEYIGNDVLESYFAEVEKRSYNRIDNLTIVYTALNGTGVNTLPELIKRRGANIILNEVQCKEDKDFTTCPYPNPEKQEVFVPSYKLAIDNNADLIIATDPDSDRVGVEVRVGESFRHFTGNEIGALLTDYVLSESGAKGYIVRSIVSTTLADKVAQKHGAKIKTVLTGFKYIGDFIRSLEDEGREKEFLLAFEESYGYLSGSYIRDKDATLASMLICEMASKAKQQGKTLVDKIEELYSEFGLYEHVVKSYKFAGAQGDKKMKDILKGLHLKYFEYIAGSKVVSVLDYQNGVEDLPCADVIEYKLDNGGSVVVRPSGTEPLIKVYVTFTKDKESNSKNFNQTFEFLEKVFE